MMVRLPRRATKALLVRGSTRASSTTTGARPATMASIIGSPTMGMSGQVAKASSSTSAAPENCTSRACVASRDSKSASHAWR